MEKSFYETHKNEIKKIGESAKKQLLEDHIPFWEPRVWIGNMAGILTVLTEKEN